MGGKSSSAPPPDPRLVEAQIRSMGVQDSAINQVMKNANQMMPIQKAQMQLGLDSSRTAYNQSQEDRTWMLGRRGMLSGVQDKVAAQANDFNETARGNELSQQGMADVEMGLSGQRESAMRSASRRGLSASAVGDAFARQGTGGAMAKAQAAFMARNAAKAEGLQLTDRAGNMLAGYPAMAMGATGAGAGFGAAGLGLANQGLAGMNSGYGAAGTMAGQMGSNASSMYGAMGSYKNGADQIAASNDPFNTILGAAAGAGMTKMMSDRRLKTNIRKVGKLDNGLTVYVYRYKAGGPDHMGVMADEVVQVNPKAVSRMPSGYDAVDYSKL